MANEYIDTITTTRPGLLATPAIPGRYGPCSAKLSHCGHSASPNACLPAAGSPRPPRRQAVDPRPPWCGCDRQRRRPIGRPPDQVRGRGRASPAPSRSPLAAFPRSAVEGARRAGNGGREGAAGEGSDRLAGGRYRGGGPVCGGAGTGRGRGAEREGELIPNLEGDAWRSSRSVRARRFL